VATTCPRAGPGWRARRSPTRPESSPRHLGGRLVGVHGGHRLLRDGLAAVDGGSCGGRVGSRARAHRVGAAGGRGGAAARGGRDSGRGGGGLELAGGGGGPELAACGRGMARWQSYDSAGGSSTSGARQRATRGFMIATKMQLLPARSRAAGRRQGASWRAGDCNRGAAHLERFAPRRPSQTPGGTGEPRLPRGGAPWRRARCRAARGADRARAMERGARATKGRERRVQDVDAKSRRELACEQEIGAGGCQGKRGARTKMPGAKGASAP
jgi:hypothetical protein